MVVLEDGTKISSKVNQLALIYFSEGAPDNLIVVDGIPDPPRFNNANDTIEITGNNLSGTKTISLFLNGLLQTTYSSDEIEIVSDNKCSIFNRSWYTSGYSGKYSLELIQSR